ncbi:MAG: hypothetical protein AB7E85_07460 [Pseudobdellovibrionaceae bacterium]
MTHIKQSLLCGLFAAIFLLGLGLAAKAQLLDNATTSRDVAFTFYKLANKDPDFEHWASYSQEYATAMEETKDEVLSEEKLNLELSFQSFDPAYHDIVIRSLVQGEVKTSGDAASLSIQFPEEGEIFFPYDYAETYFAVIADKIDVLRDIPLEPLEANYVRNKIPSDGKLFMVLKLVPYKANGNKQASFYGEKYWMLLGKIGSITLYNGDLETVWSWTASWYSKLKTQRASGTPSNTGEMPSVTITEKKG